MKWKAFRGGFVDGLGMAWDAGLFASASYLCFVAPMTRTLPPLEAGLLPLVGGAMMGRLISDYWTEHRLVKKRAKIERELNELDAAIQAQIAWVRGLADRQRRHADQSGPDAHGGGAA